MTDPSELAGNTARMTHRRINSPACVKITFLALAKDCADYLSRIFDLLNETERQGFVVECYIGENGSSDNTRDLVIAHALNDPRVTLVPTDAMAKISGRLTRMAVGREILRKSWLLKQDGSDIVCVLDTDGVIPLSTGERMDFKGAVEALWNDRQLAGISSTSIPFYYDLLALRVPEQFNYDIGPALRFGKRDPIFHYLVHARLVYPAQRNITQSIPLRTQSSFNGMALYRAIDYAAASYIRIKTHDECEHVDFNRQLCGQGRYILVGSWFKLNMPPEHGPRSLIGFIKQRIMKVLSR